MHYAWAKHPSPADASCLLSLFFLCTVLLFGSRYVSSSSSLSPFLPLPLCLSTFFHPPLSLSLSLLSHSILSALSCCLVETLMAWYKSFPPWALTWLLCFCTVFLYDKFVYGKKRRKRGKKKHHLMTPPNRPAAQRGSKHQATCNKSQSL